MYMYMYIYIYTWIYICIMTRGRGNAWESWGVGSSFSWAGVRLVGGCLNWCWWYPQQDIFPFRGFKLRVFQKQREKQGGMSDVINKSALSAMQDFLRSREASSTTEGVLAKVDLNLCYKKPCVIKNLFRLRKYWLELEQGLGQGWREGCCYTLALQVVCI